MSVDSTARGRALSLIDRVIDRQLDELEASLDGDVHPMVVDQVRRPLEVLEQALRLRGAL